MTNTEKFILKESGAKETVTALLKLFEVKERTIHNPDGSVRITRTPKVTSKGQNYFVNKFLSKKAVL